MGYSNISYYCQDKFILNRQYDYKEIIDFRPVFDWEYKGNIDYTLKMTGKVNKENAEVTGGLGGAASVNGKKISYLSTESGYLDARVMGTTVNKVLAYMITVVAVLVLQSIAAVVMWILYKGDQKSKSRKSKKKV